MKQKKMLSLLLAVIMAVLMFSDLSLYSFAANETDRTADLLDEDFKISFPSGNPNEGTLIRPEVGVVVKKDKTDGIGFAYPAFFIDVDLSRLSSSGEAGSKFPKTPDDQRLKEGDFVLLEVPANVELRKSTFEDQPFQLKKRINGKEEVIANVKKHAEGGKQYLKIIFTDKVNDQYNVEAEFNFESTVQILNFDPISFDFKFKDKIYTLRIEAIRKVIYTKHILKKNIANVVPSQDGTYALFKYTLLGNRNQDTLGAVTIQDRLENGTPEKALDFKMIGFDKTSFEIEEGYFSEDFESVMLNTPNSPKKYYHTKNGEFSFDDGNITLSFGEGENPHSFELKVKNPQDKGYKVSYGVKVPVSEVGRNYSISNSVSMLNEKLEPMDLGFPGGNEEANPPKKVLSFTASGSIKSDSNGRILIIKQEAVTKKPVEGAVFRVYQEGVADKVQEGTTDQEGRLLFDHLRLGKDAANAISYSIYEVSAPESYEQPKADIPVKTVALHQGTIDDAEETIEVENIRKTIDIKVHKSWAADQVEEKEVEFTLQRHIQGGAPAAFTQKGVEVSKKLPVNQVQKFVEFKGLHEYDEDGKKYIYTVLESEVEGYTSNAPLTVTDQNEVTVINTKKPTPSAPSTSYDHTPNDSTDPSPSQNNQESEVKRITPDPKPQEPKTEKPKVETPKTSTEAPEQTPPKTSTEKILIGGSSADEKSTEVLPGSIPELTGSQTGAKNHDRKADPKYVKKLPKTGEGMNTVTFSILFAVLGMSFISYGIYYKKKC